MNQPVEEALVIILLLGNPGSHRCSQLLVISDHHKLAETKSEWYQGLWFDTL